MTAEWLDELNAKYGEPRIAYPDPVDLGDRKRRCWVWFSGGRNHNLAIDQDGWRWTVRASGHSRAVKLEDSSEPDDAAIRAVLRAAGMLP